MTYIIEEISDVGTDFDLALELMYKNIHQAEISSREQFIEALTLKKENKLYPDNYHLRVYKESNNILSVSCGYYIADISMGLVNYLVVEKENQSKGIGRLMRSDLLTCFDKDAMSIGNYPAKGYLGEIKSTNPWLAILQLRYNIFPIDIDYYQPELKKNEGDVQFVLYYQGRSENPETIDRENVIKIVESIYKNAYDIINPKKNKSFNKIIKSMNGKKIIQRKAILKK